MPVKARELVRHWSAWPGPRKLMGFDVGPAVWWDDVWVKGDQNGALSVFLHEVGHVLDRSYMDNGLFASTVGGDPWGRAVAADSCVADITGRWTSAENFAQCAVMVAYDLNVASIDSFNISCMSNQFSLCKEKLSGALKYNPSDMCDPAKRWPDSYVPTLSRVARKGSAMNTKAYMWSLNRQTICISYEAYEQGLCDGLLKVKRSF